MQAEPMEIRARPPRAGDLRNEMSSWDTGQAITALAIRTS